MFHGREEQRKRLSDMINARGQMISLIYGRRRVGKSELIKQVLRETIVDSIYYECKQTTEQNNVDSLAELIAEKYNFPKPSFKSMEELLRYLFKKSEREPLVIVLDEYPYLRENLQGADSIIQTIIDGSKDSSNVKLILCGSYVDTMKALLSKQNPLYGRVDVTIDLKPMDYYESSLFYEGFSAEDKVKLSAKHRSLHVEDYCEGCGSCVRRCASGALTLVPAEDEDDGAAFTDEFLAESGIASGEKKQKMRAKPDDSKCVRCGYCTKVCPVFALKIF